MKIHLTFKESDFENMKSFDKAVKNQLGNDVYVGTDSLCLYFSYPKELSRMLRPYPEKMQLEFDVESEDTNT